MCVRYEECVHTFTSHKLICKQLPADCIMIIYEAVNSLTSYQSLGCIFY